MAEGEVRATRASVAVFGAAGHTGRFVVEELMRRGMAPLAIARDAGALAAVEFRGEAGGEREIVRRQASVEDGQSLDGALAGAMAVINCAGPFLETADAVASAALRAGIHYLDVTAEQTSARRTLETFDAAAREAGVAVVPSMSFYGGFADLLVTAVLEDWGRADRIDVMIGLDSWHPTRGTRLTGERNTAQRLMIADGVLVPVSSPRLERNWVFDEELGRQAMVETPFSEMILVARHLETRELHTWLNRKALDDIHDSATPVPEPEPAEANGRSSQKFSVEVVATREGGTRRLRARGRDIYAFSATLVVEVVGRLLEGKFSGAGAQAPGAMLNSREVLAALAPELLTSESAEECFVAERA